MKEENMVNNAVKYLYFRKASGMRSFSCNVKPIVIFLETLRTHILNGTNFVKFYLEVCNSGKFDFEG